MGANQRIAIETAEPLTLPVSAPATASKLLGLEFLRFASALAILFYHYPHFARMAGQPALANANMPFYALLWPFYDLGQFGVQVFWGISGYIFFWKYGAAIHSRAVSARRFFWLRFSRLYPLHLLTLITVVALQAVYRQLEGRDYIYPSHDAGSFVRQLFLATDWGPPVAYSFNGPIWSISAEVAVYAAFFALLRWFGPSLRLCLAIVTMGLALQMAGMGWAVVGCATYFFAGGLAALAPPRAAKPAAAIFVAVITICAMVGITARSLPIVTLAAIPCLLIVISRDWPGLGRWAQPIQAAGNLTYSSYLLHFPLQLLLAIGVAAGGLVLPLQSPLFLIAYIGVTLTAAALSHRMIELPAQRWLRQKLLAKS